MIFISHICLWFNNMYSISQEICTRFLLCCALLWLYIDWFHISIRLTSLALWQYNDCPNASKATLMNMDTYFMWIHYERLHNHNKAKHNKNVCIFLGIYCTMWCLVMVRLYPITIYRTVFLGVRWSDIECYFLFSLLISLVSCFIMVVMAIIMFMFIYIHFRQPI